jgi:ketosteroid isomerase-like protein
MNRGRDSFRGVRPGKRLWPFILAGFVAALMACRPAGKVDVETVSIIVRTILEQQVRDWNEGKVDKFMRGYAQADSTRFASGGDVSKGWSAVLARYQQKYPNKVAMGRLTFSEIDVDVLSADAALAFGRWRLERPPDNPAGLFTLLFRNTKDGWRIVHDHTSAPSRPTP